MELLKKINIDKKEFLIIIESATIASNNLLRRRVAAMFVVPVAQEVVKICNLDFIFCANFTCPFQNDFDANY